MPGYKTPVCESNEQRREHMRMLKKGIKTDQRHQTTASTNWNKKRWKRGDLLPPDNAIFFYMKNISKEEEEVAKRNDAIMCIHTYILNYIVASN